MPDPAAGIARRRALIASQTSQKQIDSGIDAATKVVKMTERRWNQAPPDMDGIKSKTMTYKGHVMRRTEAEQSGKRKTVTLMLRLTS